MKINKAIRRRVPGLISLGGVSGSGKTFSALLLAAGLCAQGKRVGFVDTEMGRGSLYADDPTIKTALPEGYDIIDLTEPFTPDRYTQALDIFEKGGNHDVVIVDSGSHAWEGFGGCSDIAENNKLKGMPNWSMAKIHHKRMMNKMLARPFHIIFCLRAREKVEMITKGGKTEVIPIGIQPIQEKNFKFEMLISTLLDENTKFPLENQSFHKVPEPQKGLFSGSRFITKADGEKLRNWINGGTATDISLEVLKRDCREAALFGTEKLLEHWKSLSKDSQGALVGYKDECKAIAAEVDRQIKETETKEVENSEFGI